MNAGCVALAAPGGFQSCHAPHRQKLGADPLLLKYTQQVVKRDAVTADHHQIGQLQIPPEKLHLNDRACFDDLLVAADCGKTVGPAEGSHAPGALSHGECRERRRRFVIRCLSQSNE
jgi:hypothetical protein